MNKDILKQLLSMIRDLEERVSHLEKENQSYKASLITLRPKARSPKKETKEPPVAPVAQVGATVTIPYVNPFTPLPAPSLAATVVGPVMTPVQATTVLPS